MSSQKVIFDSDDDEDEVVSANVSPAKATELAAARDIEVKRSMDAASGSTDLSYFKAVYESEHPAYHDFTTAANDWALPPRSSNASSACERQLQRSLSAVQSFEMSGHEPATVTPAPRRAKSTGGTASSASPCAADAGQVDIWEIPSSPAGGARGRSEPHDVGEYQLEPLPPGITTLAVAISPPPRREPREQKPAGPTELPAEGFHDDLFRKYTGESSTAPNETPVGFISPPPKTIGPGDSYIVSSSPAPQSSGVKRSKSEADSEVLSRSAALSQASNTSKKRAKRSRTVDLGEPSQPVEQVTEVPAPLKPPPIAKKKQRKPEYELLWDSLSVAEDASLLPTGTHSRSSKRSKSTGAQDLVSTAPTEKKSRVRRAKSSNAASSSSASETKTRSHVNSQKIVRGERPHDDLSSDLSDPPDSTAGDRQVAIPPEDKPRSQSSHPVDDSGIHTHDEPRSCATRPTKDDTKRAITPTTSDQTDEPPSATAQPPDTPVASPQPLTATPTKHNVQPPPPPTAASVATTPRKPSPPPPPRAPPHSPLRSGKVPYRVGLSKRSRIAPLLKSLRK